MNEPESNDKSRLHQTFLVRYYEEERKTLERAVIRAGEAYAVQPTKKNYKRWQSAIKRAM